MAGTNAKSDKDKLDTPPADETVSPAVPALSDDAQRAAAKRAAALESPDQNEKWIAALLEERRGYVTRGLDDRVKQVDEQLKLRGYKGSKAD